MSKHTAGPWVIQGKVGYRPTICNEAWRDFGDGAKAICDMRGPLEPYPPNMESAANALLVASAPELLASLEAAYEAMVDIQQKHLSGCSAVTRALFQKRIDSAQTAINHARGL